MIWYLFFAAIAATIATENSGIRPNTLASIESECTWSCVAEGGTRSECKRRCKCAKERTSAEFSESEIISFWIRKMYGQKQKYIRDINLGQNHQRMPKVKIGTYRIFLRL